MPLEALNRVAGHLLVVELREKLSISANLAHERLELFFTPRGQVCEDVLMELISRHL